MALAGRITGETILVFEESSGLALSDIIQGAPLGTSKEWGEFERSVAQETTNIVGCAFLNAVASHLPGGGNSIIPGPPEFRLEFAASLLEFALFDQAAQLERVLLIETRFLADPSELGWTLLLAPSADTLRDLAAALDQPAA
jgi:chemotaxis protein CheC